MEEFKSEEWFSFGLKGVATIADMLRGISLLFKSFASRVDTSKRIVIVLLGASAA